MDKIDELENRIHDNQRIIENKQNEIRSILAELVEGYMDNLGLISGKTIVEQRGDRYVVKGMYCSETHVLRGGKWLTGYKIKKNGEPGVQLVTIYDGWRIVE